MFPLFTLKKYLTLSKKRYSKYEFAIKKEVRINGKETFTPLVRKKSLYFPNSWSRIVLVEGVVMLMELDWEPGLSKEQCKERIESYQEYLKKIEENNIATIEFHNLKDFEL